MTSVINTVKLKHAIYVALIFGLIGVIAYLTATAAICPVAQASSFFQGIT